MQIKFIKERTLQAVGAQGPFTRIFAIGDVIDLPEISAQSWLSDGGAVLVHGKPVKDQPAGEAVDETEADQPAPKRFRK
jgi:hypothetical protein